MKVIRLWNSRGFFRDVSLEEVKLRFKQKQRGVRLFTAPIEGLKAGDWVETLNLPTANGIWDEDESEFCFVPEFWTDSCEKYAIIHRFKKCKDNTFVFDGDLGHSAYL